MPSYWKCLALDKIKMKLRKCHCKKWPISLIAIGLISFGFLSCTLPRAGAEVKDLPAGQGLHADCRCEGGAYPSDLTKNYQGHYLFMVIDSYIVNQNLFLAQERLKSFPQADKIRALAEQSVHNQISEKSREAQLTNELAVALKEAENWNSETIVAVITQLASEYQGDQAKKEALDEFSGQLTRVKPN